MINFDENLADFGCGLEEENSMSKNAAAFLKTYARTCTVSSKIATLEAAKEKEDLIKCYLDFCYNAQDAISKAKTVIDITLREGDFQSITSKSVPDVKGDSSCYLYVVEFFTHCCINCIHSIEDVRGVHEEIENAFKTRVANCSNGFKGIKILSIHSPKFPREKDTESIKAFCKRMKMDHSEVVNDPKCILWNELGVTCWPTLLILGPNTDGTGPNLLFNLMGEGHKEELSLILGTTMEYFCNLSTQMVVDGPVRIMKTNDNTITNTIHTVNNEVASAAFFKFPGKVSMLCNQIVVADSGNNRLVVLSPTGHVERIVGGPTKGNRDGSLENAQFYNPQGIAIENKFVFYVADTGNHAIRKVDLKLNQVSTLIRGGSSTQLNDETVILKSPWDLAFFDSETLIIAAAGNHRLFGYFFSDANLFGVDHKANTFAVVAGSGREENRNNSYILKASFAQPSGIIVVTDNHDNKIIYIADSESSSIRSVTPKAQVVGVVGGSRDPTDLFSFGDVDGKGVNAKLQHPMGVCEGRNPMEILIADTYNHKIKTINAETKESITLISTSLNEPSGICKDPSHDVIYVADTNNHSIKVVDLANANVREINVVLPDNMKKNSKDIHVEKIDKEFQISALPSTKLLKFNLSLSPLPDAFEGGQWKILCAPHISITPQNGEISKSSDANAGTVSFIATANTVEKTFEFYVVTDVFFCSSNSCLKRSKKIKIVCSNDGTEETMQQNITWSNISWE